MSTSNQARAAAHHNKGPKPISAPPPRRFSRGPHDTSLLPARPGRSAAIIFAMGAAKPSPWLPSFVRAVAPTSIHIMTPTRHAFKPVSLPFGFTFCWYADHADSAARLKRCHVIAHALPPGNRNGQLGSRECGCYLVFLQRMWDRLPDDMLFLHDSPEEVDVQMLVRALASPKTFAHVLNEKRSTLKCFERPGLPTAAPGWLYGEVSAELRRASLASPHCVYGPCCAMFKVSKEAVLRQPRQVYAQLYDYVNSNHGMAREPHTRCHRIEFVWPLLFGESSWQHPIGASEVLRLGLAMVTEHMVITCKRALRNQTMPELCRRPAAQSNWMQAVGQMDKTLGSAEAVLAQRPEAVEIVGHVCQYGTCRYLQHSSELLLRELEALEYDAPLLEAATYCGCPPLETSQPWDYQPRAARPQRLEALFLSGLRILRKVLDGDQMCALDSASSRGDHSRSTGNASDAPPSEGPMCSGRRLLEDAGSLRRWVEVMRMPLLTHKDLRLRVEPKPTPPPLRPTNASMHCRTATCVAKVLHAPRLPRLNRPSPPTPLSRLHISEMARARAQNAFKTAEAARKARLLEAHTTAGKAALSQHRGKPAPWPRGPAPARVAVSAPGSWPRAPVPRGRKEPARWPQGRRMSRGEGVADD